jgi:uncharacterized membrane protein YkvA (DUF1232 family)
MAGPRKIIGGSNGGFGFIQGIADHLKLVWRLWMDKRVSSILKLLPFGSLIYMVSPIDIAIPVIDDIGVFWFFTYLFVELCPLEIVEEHRASIKSLVGGSWKKDDLPDFDEEIIVDAHYEEKKSDE